MYIFKAWEIIKHITQELQFNSTSIYAAPTVYNTVYSRVDSSTISPEVYIIWGLLYKEKKLRIQISSLGPERDPCKSGTLELKLQ